jgi:hypothetical protein
MRADVCLLEIDKAKHVALTAHALARHSSIPGGPSGNVIVGLACMDASDSDLKEAAGLEGARMGLLCGQARR